MGEDEKPIPALTGWTFLCEVPKPLGRVTKLTVKGGRVIAETESGTPMIVPNPPSDHDPNKW